MDRNRITPGAAARRALLLALACLALAAALGGCGRGGKGGEETAGAASDKAADAALLNGVLSRQLGAVAAYPSGYRDERGEALALLRKFRAQEQEHADGIVKALRGLGEAAEAEPETIDPGRLGSRDERLEFLYELESATIDAELAAIAKLVSPAPRTLLASTAANQAQHLVVLRRLLGEPPLQTVPVPFESGTTQLP